jgi:hypothetical protein
LANLFGEGWWLDPQAHIDQIGRKAGFFIGPDGGAVGGIDVEAEFGQALSVRPGFQGVDDELVDAFTAVDGIDVHKATVGVVGMFEVVAGGVDAGIAGADEGAGAGVEAGVGAGVGAVAGFGDDEMDMRGGEHFIEIVIVDRAFLDSGVHGAFRADHALFKAQERWEVGGSGRANGNRHAVKLRNKKRECWHS